MLRDYLRSFWLGVLHNKVSTLINVGGLALGLAVFFALVLQAQREFTWDAHWDDADRIYLAAGAMESPGGSTGAVLTNVPWALGSTLQSRNPDALEVQARVLHTSGTPAIAGVEHPGAVVAYAEPTLLDLVQLDTLDGSLEEVFADPRAIAISARVVEQYFGAASPLDRTLSVTLEQGSEIDYVVKAVYRVPGPSQLNSIEFLALLDPAIPPMPGLGVDIWGQSPMEGQYLNVRDYFKVREGFDAALLETDLRSFMDANGYYTFGSSKVRYAFRKLQDDYLFQRSNADAGNYVQRLWIQIAIGVLVLLTSGCNFVMLATLHSVDRMREVGIRKTVGGEAAQLLRQYLMDAFCQTLVAAMLALTLLELALPNLQVLLGLPFDLDLMSWRNIGFCLLIVALFALVSGLYPALLMARGKPAALLRNGSGAIVGGGSVLRRLLVGIQFTVVIVLLLASAVVRQQIEYTRERGPGYNLTDTVSLRVNEAAAIPKVATLLEEFARVPGVLATSSGSAAPGTSPTVSYPSRTTAPDGAVVEATLSPSSAGAGYFGMMSVPVLAGREFARDLDSAEVPDGATRDVLLNASAVRALGFATPEDALGSLVDVDVGANDGTANTQSLRVIGVIADVLFRSIMVPPRPEYYQYRPNGGFIVVKLQPGADATVVSTALEETWREVVGDLPFQASGSWDLVNQLRREEFEARLIIGSSVLAMVIALLGLYGLAAASVVKRVKEIGVRKVMGADAMKIVMLLLWQFSQPVVVANLVAWPLGFWVVLQWLERFPYRLDMQVIVLSAVAASALALGIAWLTIGFLAARAADQKPALALRYE
jgi:putative ABC transport system permease protein